jgi:hypothetical protein
MQRASVVLIWVCALQCEARPVIDRYRLKKSQDNNPFDLYVGDGMALVVSGVGKIASASASAWVASRFSRQPSLAWINLGTAGAGEHELGRLFSLHQVVDADDGRRYYPAPAGADDLQGCACMTLSQPSEDYRDDCLYDMEASGYLYASLRFSSAELVRSLKIVSDNRYARTGRNREQVSRLVRQQIDAITRQADALIALDDELATLSPDPEYWRRLTALTHFSQTQKNRLRVLWRYLMNRDFDADRLLADLAGRRAADIIGNLEQLSHRDGERL